MHVQQMSIGRCRPKRDDDKAMTAVIEFLSAFILFLMIVTAYISLTQINPGPNDPELDRLDSAAVEGLQRLTDDGGWFVPWTNGVRDLGNATSQWEVINASVLIQGDLLPALVDQQGRMMQAKLDALSNVTEAQLARGIGLDDQMAMRLMVRVVASDDPSRLNQLIFDDGADRSSAKHSATVSRSFNMAGETVQVTLEVHDGSRHFAKIEISEFMTRPADMGPEWIELRNPNSFAVNMTGWGVTRTTGVNTIASLFVGGVLAGGEVCLLSGWPALQPDMGAAFMIDLSANGLLGVGATDGLGDVAGSLVLTWADTVETAGSVVTVDWDTSWGIGANQSINYLGGLHQDASSWDLSSTATPGLP